MELDDLKTTWNDVSTQVTPQQNLTPDMIEQMTQRKYYSKIKKIAYPEIAGVIVCCASVCYIALNFYKLDTAFLQGTGIAACLLLLTLSVISLISIRRLNIKGNLNKPYVETLKIFATQKLQFHKLQKINITLSYLLLVTVIILLSKLFNGIDITNNKYFWVLSFTIGYIFLLFYSKWVLKFYNKTLSQTEELLRELQDSKK